MIEVRSKQILIDGQPRIVMAGEVHYFRVPREEWGQRLDLLIEAGCRAVASYIPWIFHELPDGTIDVSGDTRPERDVAAFIDLCHERGLWFIARPGPFVMAELKNEGIPYRIYREHPEVIPVGWDAKPAPTRTVDYLAPAFIEETARWYAAIMPLLASRLEPSGGNVIMVQLDNEIGMLAWVSNSPDLTDGLVAEFGHWVADRGASAYPVAPGDGPEWAAAVRSPEEGWAGALRQDLGVFMRGRFARYAEALRGLAEEHGVTGVPFAINIHGTEGAGGEPFPIGISQLVETYAAVPGMVSGSDHYLGEVTLNSATDLYVMNAYMDAVHDADQPLTSLEFEAGTGDYGGGVEQQYDPSTVDLKTRLCLAQGNRLINYYLLAGGINPRLDEAVDDGNERLSFTGERHGTAAPIGPEGQRGLSFDATRGIVAAVNANEPWLSRMDEDHDDIQLGLVLDAYLTEYHHPGSAAMTDAVQDLAAHRGAGQRRALARSLRLDGFRFGAVHLEARAPRPGGVLVLGTGRYLSAVVQQRVVDHVTEGGGLLLLGRLPELDLDGSPCTLLADALGLSGGDVVRDDGHYFPTAVAHGWATPWPETRVGWRQELHAGSGDVVLTDLYGAICGVDVPLGAGRAVVLTAELPSDRAFFARVLDRLGARPGLAVDTPWPGVFATTTSTDDGQRAVHVVNVSGFPAAVGLGLDGIALNDGAALTVPGRTGHILPLGLDVGGGGRRIEWATAEIAQVSTDSIRFGPGLGSTGDPLGTTVVFAAGTPVADDPSYAVSRAPEGGPRVTSAPGHRGPLEVRFA